MKIILFFIVCILAISSFVYAATLLDVDWATGTGESCTVLQDGVFTVCTDPGGESFTVVSGGPGNRNYLAMQTRSGDVTNHLRASDPSMGGPSTAYIRFWFRKNVNCGAMHPLYISNATAVDSGFGAWRDYTDSFSMITNVYSGDDTFYYNGTITPETWYRLEYKIESAGGSNGTITARLDGVDITTSLRSTITDNALSTYNGNLTLQALNYVNLEVYSGQCVSTDWLNIAGLKITDGPDWIGGDDTPSVSTITGCTISGATIQ